MESENNMYEFEMIFQHIKWTGVNFEHSQDTPLPFRQQKEDN